jgi:hypothetical protein
MVLRLLFVADAVILGAVGFLSLLFFDRPGGFVVTAVAWVTAIGLLCGVPFTDPHRDEGW